ncbi:MAG: hypothetical protein Nk1A_7400 [Endomicrobiia bacterium]|nr:MAG: hypothetical protein Nk1A_7400 [Endomicrobiia bacterium]
MKKGNFTEDIRKKISHPVVEAFIGKKTKGIRKENRSRRLYISVKPSMFALLQKEAQANEISMNQILKEHQEKQK